jgi:hypothetical protein
MSKLKLIASLLALLVPLASGCSYDAADGAGDDPDLGKADADDVSAAIRRLTLDGVLDASDVAEAFGETGGRVSMSEMLVIRDALESTDFQVTDDAVTEGHALARMANLLEHEAEELSANAGMSYAGTEIPAAVQELVARARLNGAVSFDVRETKSDGEQRWTPYPATTPPVENMTFEHTEVSPQRLAADLADTAVTYNAIVGTETAEECDAAGNCLEFTQAKYEQRTGGSGNVASQFDEAGHHPDIFARGSSNQIWANNCAILSDGSLHCLPAARRSVIQDVILTNPALSRCNEFQGFETGCKTLMYLGHIDIRGGTVTGVEVSGRVSKRIARGNDNLIDPIAVLEAWGFDISPGLRIRYGNTEDGTPERNLERGVLEAPVPPTP